MKLRELEAIWQIAARIRCDKRCDKIVVVANRTEPLAAPLNRVEPQEENRLACEPCGEERPKRQPGKARRQNAGEIATRKNGTARRTKPVLQIRQCCPLVALIAHARGPLVFILSKQAATAAATRPAEFCTTPPGASVTLA